MPTRRLFSSIAVFALAAGPAFAAAMTRAEVEAVLRAARPGYPADFTGRSLAGLDLRGLDLRGVVFANADLYNVNLTDVDCTGANLSGARLDLAWLIRTNFSHANLSGVAMHGPVVAPGMEDVPKDAPILVGANLSGAQIIARLNGNAEGANFSHANLGADIRNQSMGVLHTDFNNANLRRANFQGAILDYATMQFADLSRANLAGARLIYADLSGANLTGANLTGADLAHADLTSATTTGATGLTPGHTP